MAAVPIIFNLNNIVKYDDKHAWMVSEHQVASCRISDECADVLHKSPVLKSLLGYGLKVGDALYVCSEGRNLLRFRFDNLQPDTIPIPSAYYDHETKMEKLTDGNILLFMQGMHLAILYPKTGKIKEMKVAGMPEYGNFDPAFAKLDSYGNVWLDLDKLEKILGNLFTNALKHTEPGGVIRLQAGVKDKMLEISVFNSGKAIKEDKLQDVFKRYYQLADTQNPNLYGWGTGIGLYYVKRLVELHHGSIMVKNVHEVSETSAEASLRNGVEFTFCLPMDRSIYNKVEIAEQEKRVMQIPLSADCSMEAKPEENKKMNRPKILVVDDDVDVAQYLRHIFASDYEVVNRYSAEEALADLEEVKPDLILSDIIMDKMSGYEFCRVLKNDLMFSHIPVILITAMSKMSEQIEGLKLGAVAYVTKPFDPAYLKALVVSQLQNMQLLRQRLGESTETESLSEKVADTLSEQDRKFMDELYRLMEKHSNEQNLSVSTMCKDMLISPAKFNYKVKELTGETPGIFFRKYKLNRAAAWLRGGKYNVSEIAVLTGFSTAAHFSVAFKKQFGVSPSEYQ